MKSPLVKEWMTKSPITISQYESLGDAKWLMNTRNLRTLPVVEGDKLIGVITRRDLLKNDFSNIDLYDESNHFNNPNFENVGQIMTREIDCLNEDSALKQAVQLILGKKYNALPIINNQNELTGLLSTPDLFEFLLSNEELTGVSKPVKTIMTKTLITLPPNAPLIQASELMEEKRIRSIPILENGKLIGIVTRTDVLRALPAFAVSKAGTSSAGPIANTPLRYIMTSKPITVYVNSPIKEAAQLMLSYKIHSLPILDEHNLVGIITESDLFQIILGALE